MELVSPRALQIAMQLAVSPEPMLTALAERRIWRQRLQDLQRLRAGADGTQAYVLRFSDHTAEPSRFDPPREMRQDGAAPPAEPSPLPPGVSEEDVRTILQVLNDWILNQSSSRHQIERSFTAIYRHLETHYPEDRHLSDLLRALQYQVNGLLEKMPPAAD